MYLYLGSWDCELASNSNKIGITTRPLGHRKRDHSHPHPGFYYVGAWEVQDATLNILLDIERQALLRTARFCEVKYPHTEIRHGGATARHEQYVDITAILQGYKHREVGQDEFDTLGDHKDSEEIYEPFASPDDFTRALEEQWPMSPLEHQNDALTAIKDIYARVHVAKLIWACGLGKSAFAMMCVRTFGFARVLIGVPCIYLQEQMRAVVAFWFPDTQIIMVGGSSGNPSLLNIAPRAFIITTYHSSSQVKEMQFDFKIGDEAHHLCGNQSMSESREFTTFHAITASKTLFMTATPKYSDCFYSMNKPEFGELVSQRSTAWAIEQKKICDYSVVVVINGDEARDELFNSAHMAVEMMREYKLDHVLVCSNSITSANKVSAYLRELAPEDVVILTAHSEVARSSQDIICEFKSAARAIVSSVYMLGEGTDIPTLDAVVFAEAMTSEIRIVQTAMRPNRLDRARPLKHAYVILPYAAQSDYDDVLPPKVDMVLAKLRESDECIAQRVTVLKARGQTPCGSDSIHPTSFQLSAGCVPVLRTIYSKLFGSMRDSEQRYRMAREINKRLGLKSLREYHDRREENALWFDDPVSQFGLLWKTWYEFLGVDCSGFIPSLDAWVAACRDKKISSVDEYVALAATHGEFPQEPGQYYRGFTSTADLLGWRSLRSRRG
jgi:superfamily II DNA or RNA helicase